MSQNLSSAAVMIGALRVNVIIESRLVYLLHVGEDYNPINIVIVKYGKDTLLVYIE